MNALAGYGSSSDSDADAPAAAPPAPAAASTPTARHDEGLLGESESEEDEVAAPAAASTSGLPSAASLLDGGGTASWLDKPAWAAAPREPRSRRPVTAPPPSPDAPVSETPDSSVPSSPFGASPEPSPEPSPAPSDDEAASVPSDDDQSLATFMSGLGSLNGVVSLTGNRVGPWSAPSSRAGTARQSTRSRKSLEDDPE